ncbi:hypothetical protein CEXT_99451 [Caerostris extrusa]|uniref:Uncharacterized protein n=1 Tax=Caerostris extrusa TaxID=172846 RepID=A0AAV4XK17_CAEEX|nr:hypothetical protein CEXT_99451 [Caerostris extrusa]
MNNRPVTMKAPLAGKKNPFEIDPNERWNKKRLKQCENDCCAFVSKLLNVGVGGKSRIIGVARLGGVTGPEVGKEKFILAHGRHSSQNASRTLSLPNPGNNEVSDQMDCNPTGIHFRLVIFFPTSFGTACDRKKGEKTTERIKCDH